MIQSTPIYLSGSFKKNKLNLPFPNPTPFPPYSELTIILNFLCTVLLLFYRLATITFAYS